MAQDRLIPTAGKQNKTKNKKKTHLKMDTLQKDSHWHIIKDDNKLSVWMDGRMPCGADIYSYVDVSHILNIDIEIDR